MAENTVATAGIEVKLTEEEALFEKLRSGFGEVSSDLEHDFIEVMNLLGDQFSSETQKISDRIADIQEAIENADSPRAFRDAERKASGLLQKVKRLSVEVQNTDLPPEAIVSMEKLRVSVESVRDETDKLANESLKEVNKRTGAMHRDFHAAGARTLRMFQALPRAVGGANQSIQAVVRNMTMLGSQSERYGQSIIPILKGLAFSPWGFAALAAMLGGLVAQWDSITEKTEAAGRRMRIALGYISEEGAKIEEQFGEEMHRNIERAIGDMSREEVLKLRTAVKDASKEIDDLSDSLNRRIRHTPYGAMQGLNDLSENTLEVRRRVKTLSGILSDELEDALLDATRGAEMFGMTLEEVGEAMSAAAHAGENEMVMALNEIYKELLSVDDETEEVTNKIDVALERILAGTHERTRETRRMRHEHERELEQVAEDYGKHSEEYNAVAARQRRVFNDLMEKHREEDRQAEIQYFQEMQRRHEQALSEMESRQNESRQRQTQIRQMQYQTDLDELEAFHTKELAAIDHRDAHAIQLQQERMQHELQLEQIHQERQDLQAQLASAEGAEADAIRRKIDALNDLEKAYELIHERQKQMIDDDRMTQMLNQFSDVATNTGQMFGDLSTIIAKEGERGLEQNRHLLFAQAMANAVSSSIAAYTRIMETPGLGAAAIPLAATTAGSIFTSLAAQARQIYSSNPSDTLSGGGGISGSFEGMSAGALAERAGGRMSRERERSIDRDRDNTKQLEGIQRSIRDQEVVLDDETSLKNEERNKHVQRKRREGQRSRRKG